MKMGKLIKDIPMEKLFISNNKFLQVAFMGRLLKKKKTKDKYNLSSIMKLKYQI